MKSESLLPETPLSPSEPDLPVAPEVAPPAIEPETAPEPTVGEATSRRSKSKPATEKIVSLAQFMREVRSSGLYRPTRLFAFEKQERLAGRRTDLPSKYRIRLQALSGKVVR